MGTDKLVFEGSNGERPEVIPCACLIRSDRKGPVRKSRDLFPQFFPRTFFPRTFLPDLFFRVFFRIFPVIFSRKLFSRIFFISVFRTYVPSVSMAAAAALGYMTAAVATAAAILAEGK